MTTQITPRTVIEAFLPFAGEISLAQVYDTANHAGLEDQPVRLAIRRLIAAGDIVQHGRGRAGTLTLTDDGHRRLHRDRQSLALAFAQDTGEMTWDRHWHLIAVSAPETHRGIRDNLRRELLKLGAAAISTGLYASAHDLRDTLPTDSAPYISTATTTDLSVQGVNDPLLIAETLWPQAPTIAAYQSLADAIQQDADNAALPQDVRLLRLAEALEYAMREDPLVPPELRNHPWSPASVREAWAQRWEELSSDDETRIYSGWWPPLRTRQQIKGDHAALRS